MSKRTWFAVLALGLLAPAVSAAGQVQEEHGDVYDETADAKKDVDEALARAAKENRRVLLVWGGNWCSWCKRLHQLFRENGDVARELRYEYDVVPIDIGHKDKNLDLGERYGAAFGEQGVPYLTVLDAEGNVLANQETGALEDGPKHDPAKVLAFLKKHRAPRAKAADVRDRALKEAAGKQKKLLLTFGAPW